jgi:hypothetical protein
MFQKTPAFCTNGVGRKRYIIETRRMKNEKDEKHHDIGLWLAKKRMIKR